MFLTKMSFWNTHHFMHEALLSLCDEAWSHALSFTALNVFLCNVSGIALSFLTAITSVRHLQSNVWNAIDSNLLVDSSNLTFMFPLHQAEIQSGDMRGFVKPTLTLDDILHSPN